MDTQQEEYEQGVYRLEDIPKHLRKYFSPKPLFDFRPVAKQLYRVTKDGGVLVWVVGDSVVGGGETLTSFRQALYFQEIGFRMFDTMIYQKSGPSNPPTGRYFQVFEYMFVLSKGKPKTVNLLKDRVNRWYGLKWTPVRTRRETNGELTRRSWSKDEGGKKGVRFNVWTYPVGYGNQGDVEAFDHPATFPEALAGDHILSWSNPGDIVLDPMMGSGTTGKMAVVYGRNFIGYEISEDYFAVAVKRIGIAGMQAAMELDV